MSDTPEYPIIAEDRFEVMAYIRLHAGEPGFIDTLDNWMENRECVFEDHNNCDREEFIYLLRRAESIPFELDGKLILAKGVILIFVKLPPEDSSVDLLRDRRDLDFALVFLREDEHGKLFKISQIAITGTH